jgi:hypothetical protein
LMIFKWVVEFWTTMRFREKKGLCIDKEFHTTRPFGAEFKTQSAKRVDRRKTSVAQKERRNHISHIFISVWPCLVLVDVLVELEQFVLKGDFWILKIDLEFY